MVKKLFKYEFAAFSRVLIPVYVAMGGIAVLSRILQIFSNATSASSMLLGSSIFMYAIAVITAFGFVNVFAVVRFYKNMFTGEGYLTLTLPVTAAEHIWTKLLSAMLFNLFSVIAFVVSISIITAGDLFTEIFKSLVYEVKRYCESESVNFWFNLFEIVLNIVLSTASTILLFYTCLSIGQLSKKNRILSAVGVYFAYIFGIQILGSVVMAMFLETDFMVDFIEFIFDKQYILQGGLAIAFFFITRHILTNKLNLE